MSAQPSPLSPWTLLSPTGPFRSEVARAHKLGFTLAASHDAREHTISIRMNPTTRKARLALIAASEDPACDGVEASATYDPQAVGRLHHALVPEALRAATAEVIRCCMEQAEQAM